VTGVILALLILLPEGLAALSAARRAPCRRASTWRLAHPSPPSASPSQRWPWWLVLKRDLVLGLDPKDSLLLGLTIVVSLLTFGTGRTNILYGFVHLVIFVTFVFLVFVP
jgi:Ca2+:H+ antiporter